MGTPNWPVLHSEYLSISILLAGYLRRALTTTNDILLLKEIVNQKDMLCIYIYIHLSLHIKKKTPIEQQGERGRKIHNFVWKFEGTHCVLCSVFQVNRVLSFNDPRCLNAMQLQIYRLAV